MIDRTTQTTEWSTSPAPIDYLFAESFMKARAAAIAAGEAAELVWLLEHPPLYTAGTSADPQDLIAPDRFPVYQTGRGGQYTYHGPGQRVAYVMLNLKQRKPDVRAFVCNLEQWIIDTLAKFDIKGERRQGRVGIWVERGNNREDKIAAIGLRLHRWVSYHGISINLTPDLTHFAGIVPCGISEHGVTSFQDLGLKNEMAELDKALRATFEASFGPTIDAAPIS